jgi:peptide/nickel transport system substrate-binding protein
MSKKRWVRPLAVILALGLFLALYSTSTAATRLNIAVGQEPTSLDLSAGYLASDYITHYNLGELLMYTPANGKLGPGLATSWKISPDGKVIDFTLRKGVKFHSGDPLTAKDVEFSYQRGIAKSTSSRIRLKTMDRFEIIDDYHFKIYFKEPEASFIPNQGSVIIVSKRYYDRVGEEKFVKNPVGTSPYKFVSYVPGEYLDIERFEDYWDKKPPVQAARFHFIPEDTTRVAKLKTGEVDIINTCPYPFVKELQTSNEFRVVKFEAGQTAPSILFHNYNPNTPWYDRRVRLAMAHAIDCDAIIKNVLYGFPDHWAFLTPNEVGYDPTLKPYPYDPKKARALLAEAGYAKGFDLKLYWEITGRYPMAREIAEAVASYFEAVGIRTRLTGEESVAHFARMRGARKSDGEFVSCRTYGRGAEPGYSLNLHFSCDAPNGIYCSPELDKVIMQARATMDDTKRGELIKKAVRMIYDDVGRIPICDIVYFFAMKKTLDFTPTNRLFLDLLQVRDVVLK